MTKDEIAATLKLCRIRAGFEAKDVADKLISMGAIKSVKSFYNWETGRTQPDADTFMYLCNLYNVKDIMRAFGYNGKSEGEEGGSVFVNELEKNFEALNREGKRKLLDYSKDLVLSGRYAAIKEDVV